MSLRHAVKHSYTLRASKPSRTLMTDRTHEAHRWGPFTMIAPVAVSASVERWLARHEPLQRLVWVDRLRVDHDEGCEAVLAAADRESRSTPELAAIDVVAAGRWELVSSRRDPVGVAVPFVPRLTLAEAIRQREALWPEPRDALRPLCAIVAALASRAETLLRPIDPDTLAVDARGRLFIDRLFSCASIARSIGMPAPPPHEEIPSLHSPPLEETPDVRTDVCALGFLARALTEGRALSPAIEAVLDRATAREPSARHPNPAAFASALRAALGPRGPHAPVLTPVDGVLRPLDAPRALAEDPLALARATQIALDEPFARGGPWAEAVSVELLALIDAQPRTLRPEHHALAVTLEPAREALRARTRSSGGELPRPLLALLGPLEPTWIPLRPERASQRILLGGHTQTLCPMVWDELQPAAAVEGRETRFCLGCVLPVHCTQDEHGDRRVVASRACVFNDPVSDPRPSSG
jgi:hypothetical protein